MDKLVLYNLAKTYIGTPHVNGGRIKGAGLDCSTLPAEFFQELGHTEFAIEPGYSGDWFCKKNCEEILLPYLQKHCDMVDSLEPGDVISYRWGRAQYAHFAVYLGDDKVLHCQARNGVEITEISSPYFFDKHGVTRITGYWRLK